MGGSNSSVGGLAGGMQGGTISACYVNNSTLGGGFNMVSGLVGAQGCCGNSQCLLCE